MKPPCEVPFPRKATHAHVFLILPCGNQLISCTQLVNNLVYSSVAHIETASRVYNICGSSSPRLVVGQSQRRSDVLLKIHRQATSKTRYHLGISKNDENSIGPEASRLRNRR